MNNYYLYKYDFYRKLDQYGFKEYYTLIRTGIIYNSKDKTVIYPNKQHYFSLLKKDGTREKITLKNLYRKVFNTEYSEDFIQDLNGEIWKQLEQYNPFDWISTYGRIKTTRYYITRLKKTPINNKGYKRVYITKKYILVHQLTAETFLGKQINAEIDHKNANRLDNRLSNLQYLTRQEHREKHKQLKRYFKQIEQAERVIINE